jgi:D-glycero-D-manno-heptose 1,7-bisphosphate phosphatase
VRILVAGSSLDTALRMQRAAVGLAQRGHRVWWLGAAPPWAEPPPAELVHLRGVRDLVRASADVVLGGGRAPLRVAFAGWLVRARCMVLALDRAAVARWGWAARGAWSTLHAWGLIEDAEGPALRRDPLGLDVAQLALWPEGEPAPAPGATHADTEVLERTCERALAWHRGRTSRPAVFVDRDGTLVIERGYLSDPEDLELLPGAARALHELQGAGLPIVVISNQSGVGRGFFPLARVYEAMARLRGQLRAAGVEVDGIYFCPHRPEEGCSCRKPGTALLERAAEDHLLQLPASFMVGDKLLDVETAHRVRALGVLVRSGYGREEEREAGEYEAEAAPDFVCDDLAAAAAWILATKEGAESG